MYTNKQVSDFKYAFLLAAHQVNDFLLQQYALLQEFIPSTGDLFLLLHREEKGEELNLPPNVRYYTFNMDSLNALEYYAIEEALIPGSNHFPVLQFYKDHPEYDYYWNIEYDVHFSGKWSSFFEAANRIEADFLTSHIRKLAEDLLWYWWKTLIVRTMKIPQTDFIRSFNPIYRISKNALACLDECLSNGNAGHHEVFIPTVLNFLGYTIADLGGDGTFVPADRKNKWYISKGLNGRIPLEGTTMRFRPEFKSLNEINQKNKLYHPVKALLKE